MIATAGAALLAAAPSDAQSASWMQLRRRLTLGRASTAIVCFVLPALSKARQVIQHNQRHHRRVTQAYLGLAATLVRKSRLGSGAGKNKRSSCRMPTRRSYANMEDALEVYQRPHDPK